MSELWVDTDLGFDDIHALLLLRCHGIKPVAHSLVFGCSTLDQVAINAQGCEEAFHFDSLWHRGAGSALDGQCRTAAHVLGNTGMQSRGLTLTPQAYPTTHNEPAVNAMINWLSSNPHEPQILALGPLTNLARLITEAPHIAARLSRITWMGGSNGRGNQTDYAEFNAWADAKAADIVMQSGIHVHIVELEACRQLQLTPNDLEPLSLINNPTAQLLHDLLGGYLDIGLSRGRSGMSLYDPLAAAAVVLNRAHPLGSAPVTIRVETHDQNKLGQTHIHPATDTADKPHSLCLINNVDAVHDMLIDALISTAINNDSLS